MPSLPRRSWLALLPSLTVAVAIVLTPATAAAATRNVGMGIDRVYHPAAVTVALGNNVKWTNSSNLTMHDVNATQPYKLFSSGAAGGIHQNQSFTFTFSSAGTFNYICLAHSADGMRGTVTVPMTVARISGSPERFKVTVGSTTLSSSVPWERVVQVDLPGGGAHWIVVKTTRLAFFKYTPSARGTYRFRTYLKSTGGAGQSQTSPVFSISH